MRVENISVDKVVEQIQNKDSRSLYDAVAHLCLDNLDWSNLFSKAEELGIVKQVGLMVDIALNYVLDESNHRYQVLKNLSSKLYSSKSEDVSPFYRGDNPAITDAIARRLSVLHRHHQGFNELVVDKWGLIISLDPDKFKEECDMEYAIRQEVPKEYSPVDK